MAQKSSKQDAYNNIARVYESIMGERDDIPFLRNIIAQYAPQAESVLELACGTGSVLEELSSEYEVSGLDISAPMIKIAQTKIPHGSFQVGDMRKFSLNERFDVVLCIFDSINHLLKLSEWRQVFQGARKHLADGGVFIFDINSEQKFINYEEESPLVAYEENDVCIFNVKRKPRGLRELDIRYFQDLGNNRYQLHETIIQERTYSIPQVKKALSKYFSKVRVIDEDTRRPNKESETLYWICEV